MPKLSERKALIIRRLASETNMTWEEIADYPGVKCHPSTACNHGRERRSGAPGARTYATTEEINRSHTESGRLNKERWAY
jgi:hypothetical protein